MNFLIISVLIILTAMHLSYRSLQKLKQKAHRSAAIIKHLMPMVRSEHEYHSLDLNKLMTVLFLIELDTYKKTGQAIINATWQWKNDNPTSAMVISILVEMEKRPLKINYELTSQEISEIDEVYLQVKDLSKIEVDIKMLQENPKLKEIVEGQLVFPHKVVS